MPKASYRTNQKTAKRLERETVSVEQYVTSLKELRDYYAEHNVSLVALEATFYPSTGGTRWIATVEVGFTPARGTELGVAFRYVCAIFAGVSEPRSWELRGKSNPTYEISWFTNAPGE